MKFQEKYVSEESRRLTQDVENLVADRRMVNNWAARPVFKKGEIVTVRQTVSDITLEDEITGKEVTREHWAHRRIGHPTQSYGDGIAEHLNPEDMDARDKREQKTFEALLAASVPVEDDGLSVEERVKKIIGGDTWQTPFLICRMIKTGDLTYAQLETAMEWLQEASEEEVPDL